MNDFLARELIDVLQEIASAQRVIEKHLASIRFNINDLGMRDDLTKFQAMDSLWTQEREDIAGDRIKENL